MKAESYSKVSQLLLGDLLLADLYTTGGGHD